MNQRVSSAPDQDPIHRVLTSDKRPPNLVSRRFEIRQHARRETAVHRIKSVQGVHSVW